jgi:phenylpropionate dioxygenase-like ring-hydroxylating dioxygenase large terminal subunit
MEAGQPIGRAAWPDYRVAFPRRYWYPACQSADLGRRPLGLTLMDTPVVVFRDRTGRPRALLDRCSHRNLALSLGRVRPDGCLECAYHGWRFDGSGGCVAVPGLLVTDTGSSSRRVEAFAAAEQDGFVWIWGDPGTPPDGLPLALPRFEGRGCGQVVLSCDLDCTLHAAVENALDVPHTAFLHRGLFRGGDAKEITAERRELPGGVEVRYLGEPVRFGPLRGAGRAELTFDHWDRFLLPSVAQIEYRVTGWLRLTNTIVHLPLSPFHTRAWFVVGYWTRLPASVVRPIVVAQGRRILGQDAGVLADQTANIRRFGQVHYVSTDLDLLGNAIWRLLRQAERAETLESGPDEEPAEIGRHSVTFRA